MQLSQPTYGFTEHGKLLIESKKSMRARGIKSPNDADALMLAFAPPQFLNHESFGVNIGRGMVLA